MPQGQLIDAVPAHTFVATYHIDDERPLAAWRSRRAAAEEGARARMGNRVLGDRGDELASIDVGKWPVRAGVGEHLAKANAELGANVVISARSQDRLDRIAGEINAAGGGRAIAVTADAGGKADLETLVDKAHDAFGPVHIEFNNAAAGVVYQRDGGLWANTDAVWQTAMDVNVMATWRLTELTEADIRSHGRGSAAMSAR